MINAEHSARTEKATIYIFFPPSPKHPIALLQTKRNSVFRENATSVTSIHRRSFCGFAAGGAQGGGEPYYKGV